MSVNKTNKFNGPNAWDCFLSHDQKNPEKGFTDHETGSSSGVCFCRTIQWTPQTHHNLIVAVVLSLIGFDWEDL
jgi:hypothetical protein